MVALCAVLGVALLLFPGLWDTSGQKLWMQKWLRGNKLAYTGHLTVWLADVPGASGKGSAQSWVRSCMQAFEKKNFGIFLELECMDMAQMTARIQAGERPDVVLGDGSDSPLWQEVLTPLYESWPMPVQLDSRLDGRWQPVFQGGYALLINEDALYSAGLSPPAGLSGLDELWIEQLRTQAPQAMARDDGDATSAMAALISPEIPEAARIALQQAPGATIAQFLNGEVAVLPASMQSVWELEKQSILGRQVPAFQSYPLSGFRGHVQYVGVIGPSKEARTQAAAAFVTLLLGKSAQSQLYTLWAAPVAFPKEGLACEQANQAMYWQAILQPGALVLPPGTQTEPFVQMLAQSPLHEVEQWVQDACQE